MYKAKFIQNFPVKEVITLHYVISMDNKNQTGEAFAAFVDLVNRHKYLINKLIIITSGWLHRHYAGHQQAKQLSSNWIKCNEKYFSTLAVNYVVLSWEEFFTDEYQTALVKVNTLYQEDKAFQAIVDELAVKHAHKGSVKVAKDYTIEDATAGLIIKGHLAYPSAQLNPAFTYVMNLFNASLKYLGYRIDILKERKEGIKDLCSSYPLEVFLLKKTLALSLSMQEYGICSVEEKVKFFQEAINSRGSFIDNSLELSTPTVSQMLKKSGIFSAKQQRLIVEESIALIEKHRKTCNNS